MGAQRRSRRVRPYAATPPPATRPERRPERRGAAASTPVLARVLDGLRRLDEPALGAELAPLARAAAERWPETARPAAEVEPSPDTVRTQPLAALAVVA